MWEGVWGSWCWVRSGCRRVLEDWLCRLQYWVGMMSIFINSISADTTLVAVGLGSRDD